MKYESLQNNVRNRTQQPTFVHVCFIEQQDSLHEYHREEMNKGSITWGFHKLIEPNGDVTNGLALKKVGSPRYIPDFLSEATIDNTVIIAVAVSEHDFYREEFEHVFNSTQQLIEHMKLTLGVRET